MADDIQKVQNDLQSKLDNTVLPDDVVDEISTKEEGKSLRGVILEAFGLGAIEKIFDTAERIEEATQEHKKGLLMQAYMEQTDNIQEEMNKLHEFVSNPEGNILFTKVMRILADNPENPYYAKLLSNCLKKTVKSDFQKLFAEHNYALNQIEKLTPQGLILLTDCDNWPEYKIGQMETEKGVITSEWIDAFEVYYAQTKNITDDDIVNRISHALRELHRNGFIRSKLPRDTSSYTFGSIQEASNSAICELTELGKEIVEYID